MSKVNENFLNFVIQKKNKKQGQINMDDENNYIEGDNYRYKIIDNTLMSKQGEKKKIKEKEIIHQNVKVNENNKNDGSLKDLLNKAQGLVINRNNTNKLINENEANISEEQSDDESEDESELSDYEEEKYNHYVKRSEHENENDNEIENEYDNKILNASINTKKIEEQTDVNTKKQIALNKKQRHIECELFAENIPVDKNEKEIIKFFRNLKTGVEIARIKVLKNNKAFLKFTSKIEAEKLLKFPIKFEDHKIKLSIAHDNTFQEKSITQKQNLSFVSNSNSSVSPQANTSHTAFIGNLPLIADDSSILKTFKEYGKISSIRLMKTKDGKSKGFGYIDFKKEESLLKAVSITEPIILGGKQITIEKAKSSFNENVFKERLGKKKRRTNNI